MLFCETFSSFLNVFAENLVKRILPTMKVCSNPVGQQIDQSDLSILSCPRISCIQGQKLQVFISFHSRVIEKRVTCTDSLDRNFLQCSNNGVTKFYGDRSIRSQSSPSPTDGAKRYRQKESTPEIEENSAKFLKNFNIFCIFSKNEGGGAIFPTPLVAPTPY